MLIRGIPLSQESSRSVSPSLQFYDLASSHLALYSAQTLYESMISDSHDWMYQ